jgi:histo-blood group ABO system transferase
MKQKVGMLVIATRKYIRYVAPLWESARKYFLHGHDVTMFVFTDQPDVPAGTIRVQHEHLPWPGPTLMRYHAFCKHAEVLSKQDYLYYSDADMLFVDAVGDEILGDLVATIHPGFYNKPREQFSYETRPECMAYMPPGYGDRYYAGGFNGGRAARFLSMAKEISGWIDEDARKGLVAVWHDESHMNKYMAGNNPTVKLNPSYCFPESWNLPFPKKLLALDKNHEAMRS